MRKQFGKLEYCYFVELTKKLMVHFHIYVNRYFPQVWIKRIWQQITGNSIVYVSAVTSDKQIKYCSEYHNILKKFSFEQLEFIWKNIDRLFGQSRHFFAKSDPKERNFERVFIGKICGSFLQSLSESATGSRYFWISEGELASICRRWQIVLIQTAKDKINLVLEKDKV